MAGTNPTTVRVVLDDARAELRDRWQHYRDEFGNCGNDACDVIHEIADSAIPVYTSDLLELACDEPSLATDQPEVVGAEHFGAALSIIVGNLYERLSSALFEEWQKIEHEQQEKAEALLDEVERDSYAAGIAAGSWVIDGNTTQENARRLLDGIDEGDPAVVDSLPSAPLSGEWADSLTPSEVLGSYGISEDDPAADDILSAYEDGFSRGVLDEVVRSARAILPTVRQGSHDPVAYTFDAATHCPDCTAARFGIDEDGWIPEDATDDEGNDVGAIFAWDTSDWPEGIYCDDCHAEVVEPTSTGDLS